MSSRCSHPSRARGTLSLPESASSGSREAPSGSGSIPRRRHHPTNTPFAADARRAAGICALAHDGQILLSQTTRDLLHEAPLDDAAIRDLGEHRLTDLAPARRLFQLFAPGLTSEFPPPVGLDGRLTNLPLQATALVGREREIRDVAALLARPDTRLLTLTGPGGTGKTRLATHVAAELLDEFTDGVLFVGLAALTDARLVLPTVTRALGIADIPGGAVSDQLIQHLRGRRVLLVLDNAEHVLAAAPAIAELATVSPGVRVLVTSRVPLHLPAETIYAVAPLATPAGVCLPEGAHSHPPRASSGDDLDVVDGLSALVDASLVVLEGTDAEPRFAMLETIRQYAAELLDESGENEELTRRHAAHFLSVAEAAEPHLRESPGTWLERLEGEHDNLRVALDRVRASSDDESAIRLAGALWRFWYLKGHLTEGLRRLDEALATAHRPTAARAKVLIGAAVMALNSGDRAAAVRHAEEGVAVSSKLGDAWSAAYAGFMLGNAVMDDDPARAEQDRLGEALPMLQESLRLHQSLGDLLDTAVDLCRAASALSLAKKPTPAVQILASFEGFRQNVGTRGSSLAELNDETLAATRRQLDEEAFTSVWEQGRRRTKRSHSRSRR
jgi:predicted ATPase